MFGVRRSWTGSQTNGFVLPLTSLLNIRFLVPVSIHACSRTDTARIIANADFVLRQDPACGGVCMPRLCWRLSLTSARSYHIHFLGCPRRLNRISSRIDRNPLSGVGRLSRGPCRDIPWDSHRPFFSKPHARLIRSKEAPKRDRQNLFVWKVAQKTPALSRGEFPAQLRSSITAKFRQIPATPLPADTSS